MLVNKTVEFFLSEAAGWTVSGGGLERDAGDQITWQAAGSERPGTGRDAGDQITGKAADSERPETERDAGGGRGLGRDKMPAGAKAWAGTRCR